MEKKAPNTDIVVGLQYGSEAKGLVAQSIADYYDWTNRVGGANAGHTVRWKEGGGGDGAVRSVIREFKARHIPATFLNRNCSLSLSAGSLITWDVLQAEIKELSGWEAVHDDKNDPHRITNWKRISAWEDYGIAGRLHIDPQACVVQDRHIADEHAKKEGADLFDKIGSTREGIGACLAERVLRRGGVKLAAHEPYLEGFTTRGPVAELIRTAKRALLEGSQGTMLDNMHGYYPYCTSRGTQASAIASESGVAPHAIRHVIGVMRTYPIRVAGNSGPTGGPETTWEELSEKLDKQVSEVTTVTKRKRRVFEFSQADFKRALILNRPSIIALTFLNYLNKNDEKVTEFTKLSMESRRFIDEIETMANAPVAIMSTSADTVITRGLDQLLS